MSVRDPRRPLTIALQNFKGALAQLYPTNAKKTQSQKAPPKKQPKAKEEEEEALAVNFLNYPLNVQTVV